MYFVCALVGSHSRDYGKREIHPWKFQDCRRSTQEAGAVAAPLVHDTRSVPGRQNSCSGTADGDAKIIAQRRLEAERRREPP